MTKWQRLGETQKGKKTDSSGRNVKSSSGCDRQSFALGLIRVGLIIEAPEKKAGMCCFVASTVRSQQSNSPLGNRRKWAQFANCREN